MLKVAAFHIKRLKPWLLKSTAAMWDSNGHGEKWKYGNLMKTILNANGGGGRRQIRQIISLKFGTCPKLQTTVPNWMIPQVIIPSKIKTLLRFPFQKMTESGGWVSSLLVRQAFFIDRFFLRLSEARSLLKALSFCANPLVFLVILLEFFNFVIFYKEMSPKNTKIFSKSKMLSLEMT